LIYTILTIFIIAIDQYTKYLAVTYLQGNPKQVIQGVFELSYVQNTGAAFGIMQNFKTIFLVLTPIILALLLGYVILNKKSKAYAIPLVLIVGGAIGNYIDRIRLGYVVDFLNFIVWPVFNLADTSIVIGAAILAVILIKEEKRREDKNESAS